MNRRLVNFLAALSLAAGAYLAGGTRLAFAQTATPTPSPTPTPTATALPPPNNINNNFAVDNGVPLPWPLPALPATPTSVASPTLYAATAQHATGYPDQLATTTAQVAQFTGPINSISTPVAAMIGSGPTPSGTNLDTGVDMGNGSITFTGFAEDIADQIGPVVGTGVGFIQGLVTLGEYSTPVALIMSAQVVSMIIAAFLILLPVIVKAGQWIIDFVIRLFTLIGSWIPGT